MKKAVRWMMLASACFVISLCGTILAVNDDVVITPTGTAAMEAGQIKTGYFKPTTSSLYIYPIQHIWQQNARLFFGYDVLIKNKLHMNFTGGGIIAFSTPQLTNFPVTMQTHHIYYIDKAYADYPLGDPNNLFLQFQLGLFPYKYNPDVHNLGEYLFRSLSYPLVVYSEFDNPQVNLLGARINFQFADKLLENDLLFHSELIGIPVQDWSVTDIISSSIAKVVTFGAGVSFSHYLSVYQGQYAPAWADPYYYTQNLSSQDKNYFRVNIGTDTAYLDWKSIRVMGRFSIDPKRFIPLDIFGRNDLKLYGEADIIGLKNYPYRVADVGYDSVSDRIFYTAGFNFPGFKIIDLINGEIEYCANKSAFSDEKIYGSSTPSLYPVSLSQYTPKVNRALWRWSVYVKKSFFDDHFSIIAQAARDHKKINFYYFQKDYMSFMEALPTVHDWWWTFKTEFKF
jgi:hypothetical protein